MAKDPAMLWYWSDWNSGTCLLSRFLKGCFMDLLHAQFNHGRLSLEEIKICLGSDYGTSWPAIQKKFKQDGSGLFFNEKLESEVEKRKAFSQSRRDNVNKRYDKPTSVGTSVEDMNVRMENENGIENENLWTTVKKDFLNSDQWHYSFCTSKGIAKGFLLKKLNEFLSDIELKEDYKNLKELKRHFTNWFNLNKKTFEKPVDRLPDANEVAKKYK